MGGPGGPSLGDLDCRTATSCIKGEEKTHLLEEPRHVFMVFVHGLLLYCGLNWLVISQLIEEFESSDTMVFWVIIHPQWDLPE